MHAYLVIGPTLARDRYFAALTTRDVECLTITPEKTSITIAQVHTLLDSLQVHARLPRIIMIDPGDALTAPAANALLKTLEEPPARTTIYIGTKSPASIMATIRSRCQIIRLDTPRDSDPTPQYLPLIKSALQATAGDRIQLASSLPTDRQEALSALYALLQEIRVTLANTKTQPGRVILAQIGERVTLTTRRLEANGTVSLALQQLFLSLPRTK